MNSAAVPTRPLPAAKAAAAALPAATAAAAASNGSAAAPCVELTLRPRLAVQAQDQLRRAWQGFQKNPRTWLDQEAHEVLHAYETLVHGLTPAEPAPAAAKAGRPAATADYADQQNPAAAAMVKAFAREISADPAWLQRLEQLLPPWPPHDYDPAAGADPGPPPPFAWHALQALPRPPAPPPQLQPPAPYMPRRHYRSRWQYS